MSTGKVPHIGIDEVGRGPLAGPVSVGAFMVIDERFFDRLAQIDIPLRDSKKLTEKMRNEWFVHLKQLRDDNLCTFAVAHVSPENIDQAGIVRAIDAALMHALEVIHAPTDGLVLLDGGLRAPLSYKNQKTIIKGDEKEVVISCASIVAKVTRDSIMRAYGKKYPAYGFESHAGYGTKMHIEAIKKSGLTPIHRKSFLKNILN